MYTNEKYDTFAQPIEDLQKRGGALNPQICPTSNFWNFLTFLTLTEGLDHFYSTLRTCLASVGIGESHLTSGIPYLYVKVGIKRSDTPKIGPPGNSQNRTFLGYFDR